MEGRSTASGFSRYFPKASAFGPPPRNSTHPEASTTKRLKPLGVVTIFILPFHTLCHSSEFFDRPWFAESNCPVQDVNVQFLPRPELKLFTDSLGNDDLKFRRNLHY